MSVIEWQVEEVSMIWMDRQSVTEMDRGGVYEMDRQTKCQKNGNARSCYYILSISVAFPCFCTFTFIHFIDTSSFHFCDTWSVHPFHRHFLYWLKAIMVLTLSLKKYKPNFICCRFFRITPHKVDSWLGVLFFLLLSWRRKTFFTFY